MDRKSYPDAPGHQGTDTSLIAAVGMELSAPTLRAKVLRSLKIKPGAVHEVSRRLDLPVPTIQPRFSELRAKGLIKDSGYRRENSSRRLAVVWEVVR